MIDIIPLHQPILIGLALSAGAEIKKVYYITRGEPFPNLYENADFSVDTINASIKEGDLKNSQILKDIVSNKYQIIQYTRYCLHPNSKMEGWMRLAAAAGLFSSLDSVDTFIFQSLLLSLPTSTDIYSCFILSLNTGVLAE